MGAGVLNRFGVVSDEIHEDPDVAFAAARELGMGSVDLNSVWGKPVTDLTADEVGRLRAALRRFGLSVFMVAGLPFKGLAVAGRTPEALLASPDFAADMAMLERSLEIAVALDAVCARVHAFAWADGTSVRRPGGGTMPPDVQATVTAGLRAACARAAHHGVALGLENVRACHANSGRNTAAVIAAVGDDRLRAVWDPANAFVSGEDAPYPDGYAAVAPYVFHVHVKDARLVDAQQGRTAWECVGRGAVDYPGQLRALAAGGYDGVLCVETHWRPAGATGEQATRESFTGLRGILAGLGA